MFSVRVTAEERAALERLQAAGGPRKLGPWLLWRALDGEPPPRLPRAHVLDEVIPGPGTTRAGAAGVVPGRGGVVPGQVVPELERSSIDTRAGSTPPAGYYPIEDRIILDLCAGSGSWSAPYERAGYRVIRVTLPEVDVRTYVPPPGVWGVLAAPPCNEFSLAKRAPRDEVAGMACVNACLRIIFQARPRWWALENPTGHLSRFLGTPRDVWEPHDFGDPWTKRTAVWGEYQIPRRGPFIVPTSSAMDRPTSAARAITPPGFARAFFEANP